MTYENYLNYRGYVPDAWVHNYPAHRFAHIPYLVVTADSMRADIDLAVQRNAGLVFVADGRGRVVSQLGRPVVAGRPILWRPETAPDRPAAQGIYFVVARSGDVTISQKVIYLR